MKKTINLLVLLFAVLLLICVAPMAFAEDLSGDCGANGNNVTYAYTESNHTLTISGTGAMADYNEYSPDPIVHAPWYSVNNDITNIVITEGVTRLGNFAFFNCDVTSVSFPSSLKIIGENTFAECEELATMTIPYQVETISDGAFDKCQNLTVSFADDLINHSMVKTIGAFAFTFVRNTEIVIPDSVEYIGELAFGASSLETVHLGKQLQFIGAGAFYLSTEGTELTDEPMEFGPTTINTCMTQNEWGAVEKGMTIPTDAYYGDFSGMSIPYARTDVTINTEEHKRTSNVTWAWAEDYSAATATYTCEYCGTVNKTIEAVEVTENGTTVQRVEITLNGTTYSQQKTVYASGTCGAQGDNLTWVYDHGVLTISGTGDMADFHRINLTTTKTNAPWNDFRGDIHTVIVNEGVTSIGDYAFYDCVLLKSVSLPSTLTSIGILSFYYTVLLNSISLPENLTTIKTFAFYISAITDIVIPNSVTTIEEAAFIACPFLKTVRLGTGLQSIGDGAFYAEGSNANNSLESIVTCMTDAEWAAVTKGENIYDPIQVAFQTNAHVAGEVVRENVVPPTCETDGSYDAVTYCKYCGEELSRDSMVVIPALGHKYGNPVADWADDYSSATVTVICGNCGGIVSEEAAVTSRPSGEDDTIFTASITVDGKNYTVSHNTADDKVPPAPQYRCSMCNTYDKYKDNKVFGWLITIVHFFIHLASHLGASV